MMGQIFARIYKKSPTDGIVKSEDLPFDSIESLIATISQNLEGDEILTTYKSKNGLQLFVLQDLEYPFSSILCSVHGVDIDHLNLPELNTEIYQIVNLEEDQEGCFDLRLVGDVAAQEKWLNGKRIVRANNELPVFDRKLQI